MLAFYVKGRKDEISYIRKCTEAGNMRESREIEQLKEQCWEGKSGWVER